MSSQIRTASSLHAFLIRRAFAFISADSLSAKDLGLPVEAVMAYSLARYILILDHVRLQSLTFINRAASIDKHAFAFTCKANGVSRRVSF